MPLVFVHGVNVRKGSTEEENHVFAQYEQQRDELFKKITLAELPGIRTIYSPYWGDLGAKFRYDLVSVPRQGVETFGASQSVAKDTLLELLPVPICQKLHGDSQADKKLFLTLAREVSLEHSLDVFLATSPAVTTLTQTQQSLWASFSARAFDYVQTSPKPMWLFERGPLEDLLLQDDNAFFDRLVSELPQEGAETYGTSLLSDLKEVATTIGTVVKTVVSGVAGVLVGSFSGGLLMVNPKLVAKGLRPGVSRGAGMFLGDAFTYLATRKKETPGPIGETIIAALRQADSERTSNDPLIVVGHSFGGILLYDILTSYCPEIEIDMMVTVGTQISLFKELGLYQEDKQEGAKTEDTAMPHESTSRVLKPNKVSTWLNIFDPIDVLGFAAEGVFEGVTDYAIDNQASIFNAHTTYFYRPAFHQRLRVRLKENGFPMS